MAKFIKLTRMILNTNDIHKIVIQHDRYYINVIDRTHSGAGIIIAGFGFGTMSSHNNTIEVCKNMHPADYKIVSDWIQKTE